MDPGRCKWIFIIERESSQGFESGCVRFSSRGRREPNDRNLRLQLGWSQRKTSQSRVARRCTPRNMDNARDFSRLRLGCWSVVTEQLGNRLALRTDEVARQIAGKQRIGLCAGYGFLDVIAMFCSGAGKRDQRGRKFHLGIIAADSECLLDPRVAIEARGRIAVFDEKLAVGFGEITSVEAREAVGVSGGIGVIRTDNELREQFFRGARIISSVQGCAAQRFHVHENGWAPVQNRDGVRREFCRVVILGASEMPIVTDPWQGLRAADINRVTYQRRASLCRQRHKNERGNRQRLDSNKKAISFHVGEPPRLESTTRKTRRGGGGEC